MIKKLICAAVCCLLLVGLVLPAAAIAGKQDVLECCFTSNSKNLKIFVRGKMSDDVKIGIANKEYESTVNSKSVEIRTIFMIDDTASVPKDMREPVKKSIVDYAKRMPSNESVRIVSLNKEISSLSDGYTRDASSVEHILTKITFEQIGSHVYDGIKQAIEQLYGDDDAYYRLVVMTDGVVESGGSVSFDYLRGMIETGSRYHIDLIQIASVSDVPENTNMKSLAMLSSNTFHMMYNSNTDISYLVPGDVSLLKVEMNNGLTTGQSRGITVIEGTQKTDIGSVYFPQADVGIEPKDDAAGKNENGTPFLVIAIILAAVLIVLVGVAVFIILWLNGKQKVVVMSVRIVKEDLRDKQDVGPREWRFPVKGEFRVGRTLTPMDSNGHAKGKNDYAICETADPSLATGIGRNAFAIRYDEQKHRCIIANTAEKARFFIQAGDMQQQVDPHNSTELDINMSILLGHYTTVDVESIKVITCSKKELSKR